MANVEVAAASEDFMPRSFERGGANVECPLPAHRRALRRGRSTRCQPSRAYSHDRRAGGRRAAKAAAQNIVVKENSYLGLIRQAQRGFQIDLELSLGFDNISARPDHRHPVAGCGVDHVAVAEGLARKAIRMKATSKFTEAFARPASND